MSGPGSPGQEGPTFAPPQLPPGWIAQWDANSKKYYFVQLSTGVSQWEVPTDSAPVGGTPASTTEHPYGVPGQPQLITHPDGTQTVKHPDGTMEPVMPDESGHARGIGADGPTGDRGLGSMAMNALLGGKQSGHNANSNGSYGGLASQVMSGLTHQSSAHGQQQHTSSGGPNGLGGKLVGQLASNLFSSGNKPSPAQNYHSSQNAQPHSSGGMGSSMMGGVAHMFGGQSSSSNQNFGYSNPGHQGGYSGPAPPATYQPSGVPSQHQSPAQHHTPPTHGYQSQSQHTPYSQPPSHQAPTQYGQSPSHFGHGYGHQQTPQQPQGYGGFNPSSYMAPPPPGQYHSYQAQGPHIPHGTHPYGSNPAY